MQLTIGKWLRKYLDGTLTKEETTTMSYPPPIAKTIGFELVDLGQASATLTMRTDPAIHGNPMGTVHGGVLCDIADAAIGTAHATTLGRMSPSPALTSVSISFVRSGKMRSGQRRKRFNWAKP